MNCLSGKKKIKTEREIIGVKGNSKIGDRKVLEVREWRGRVGGGCAGNRKKMKMPQSRKGKPRHLK